jgi:lactate permease
MQEYDPLGSWPISTAAAALPILILLGLLASGRVSAGRSALAGLVSACLVAFFIFGMPARMIVASAAVGMVFAAFRIVWLILAAVFLYDLAVSTGQFEIMKASVARLSADRRLQAVLVAFSFGAFIEGAAGFGAPVAISAAFLVGLGFRPFQAALLCLIANTAPVAWGGIGTPLRTLSAVTELDVEALSATSGRILPLLSLIIPFWLVRTMTSWRNTLAVWVPLVVIGGTFAAVQFVWSNFVGFELVDIVASVSSMGAGVLILHFWKPKQVWRFDHEADLGNGDGQPEAPRAELEGTQVHTHLTFRQVARAWMPFALLTITVLIWGIPASKSLGTPAVKDWLDARLSWKPKVVWLHQKIARGEAVTGHETASAQDLEKAEMDVVPLSSTGTAVFLAAVLSGGILGVPLPTQARLLTRTVSRMRPAIFAILCMLALGFVTKYSGMDAVLGLAFTRTGRGLYPVFGTLLGWLGVALTGSDTSSNVLFGNLQKVTALKLNLNPILMASANSTGGVMGKMIDAQSIMVACAACYEDPKERAHALGPIFRKVWWHSVAGAAFIGLIALLQAYVFTGAIPVPPVK